jgi:hypothetical protein
MMLSPQTAAAPRRMPPGIPASPEEPAQTAWFGAVADEEHIVVLGGPGAELMCALLRAGAANVTHLRAHERPEADSASLLIVPRVPSLDWLATALPSIRRALTAHGRVVLLASPQAATQTQIRRMLTLHGLSAIRAGEHGQVLSAARPNA